MTALLLKYAAGKLVMRIPSGASDLLQTLSQPDQESVIDNLMRQAGACDPSRAYVVLPGEADNLLKLVPMAPTLQIA